MKIIIVSIFIVTTAIFSCASLDNNQSRDTSIKSSKPNIIVIFTDDQGYQDLGCYNSPKIKTPNLDKNFYVASSVCSPSRGSLLTGRNPIRIGINKVFFPDEAGMSSKEITIAEILKSENYNTACFGKWHLGDLKEHMPLNQGFDKFYGIPYSNDMYIGAKQEFSKKAVFLEGYTIEKAKKDQEIISKNHKNWKVLISSGLKGKSPLIEDNKIVEYPCDQSTLTERYFKKTMAFVSENKEKPFFVYLTPAMPHIPLYASNKFKGTSERGLYGDVVEEIDFYVGELFKHLKKEGLDENTLVVFTSDNGPWLKHKENGGSALPLRDGKFSVYEGGFKVPCIMRWPKKIDKGKISKALVSTTDLLPTIAYYAGASLSNHQLDGFNIANHLENVDNASHRKTIFYTRNGTIDAVRNGDWKYLPRGGRSSKSKLKKKAFPELYNLKDDISETRNVFKEYPDIVKMLESDINKKNKSLFRF